MTTGHSLSAGRLARLGLALVALGACLVATAEPADAAAEEKVTICHRTGSRTNPYDQQAVAASSAVRGHASHTGPVFGPDVDDWGDIISPIRPGLPGGLNWSTEGRAVLANGCEVEPDVGPLPDATIGEATCVGGAAAVEVTVSNAADATQPATFTIRVDGVTARTVGPLAPGESETVTLTGTPEDQVAVVEVVSDGVVVASQVLTADCLPGPPPVSLRTAFGCAGDTATAAIAVTDNGPDPLTVTLLADGRQYGETVVVSPGDTETRVIDLSPAEDQTVEASLRVDGDEVAATTITPDCVAPVARPAARVAGPVCPPPSTTVTLSNEGDPGSTVVFAIRVDEDPVQTSAPIHGGESTTIVVDLSPYEDQTVHVTLGVDGVVRAERDLTVDCVAETGGGGGGGTDGGAGGAGGGATVGPGTAALPQVGSGLPRSVVALGGLLAAAGAALLLAGLRGGRTGP